MVNKTTVSFIDWAEVDGIVFLIWKYCCPAIVLLGTFGNILSILVYSRKSLRQTSLGPQLISLSVNDLLYLYLSSGEKWMLNIYNINITEYTPVVCKLYWWMLYSTATLSPWILIVITLERLRSVFRPLDTWTEESSRMRTFLVIFILWFSVFFINSHLLYGFGRRYFPYRNVSLVSYSNCAVEDNTYYHYFYYYFWSSISYSLSVYIPFIILFASNIAILFKLGACGENVRLTGSSRSVVSRSQIQARRNLQLILVLNMFFLITTTPNTVLMIGRYNFTVGRSVLTFHLLIQIGRMLLYLNSSANFLFYLVTRQFRTELLMMFCREKINEVKISKNITRTVSS